ncbi:hypothetical protein QWY86_15225 [Pedobacter aquatilis]|uniref:hypothetical protein n=1 Tax=Pedobacter aquatilis TaxID=351343 RepID=UPI0025B41529|nr:hypothetical protein [Pedobacter aquatilis]MDN3588033.1 hypothetical protein [Pedobacter aquatilis]
MGTVQKEKIKKRVESSSKPIGLGNIFEIFSQLENIAHLLSDFLPQMERLIELMELNNQVSSLQLPDDGGNLQDKLTELLSIAKETQETSVFVKRIFTQEKPKKTKQKADKSEAINEYLVKYNKSMRL